MANPASKRVSVAVLLDQNLLLHYTFSTNNEVDPVCCWDHVVWFLTQTREFFLEKARELFGVLSKIRFTVLDNTSPNS